MFKACSTSDMSSNLRKKFTSPFSDEKYPCSRTPAACKFNPSNSKSKADERTMRLQTPSLLPEPEVPKADYSRLQGKEMNSFEHMLRDGKTPKKNIFRSLFGNKLTSLEEKSHLDLSTHFEKRSFPMAERLEEKDPALHGETLDSKQYQSTMPLHIPSLLSEARNREDSRVQENYTKAFDEIGDMIDREPPRRKVYRSLFTAKSPNLKEEFHSDKQNHDKKKSPIREEWLENKENRSDRRKLHLSLKLPVPEMLQETDFMEATNSHYGLETLLGTNIRNSLKFETVFERPDGA